MGEYDDMLDHPHHRSTNHPHMPMLNRAAQFAPFAALTGYEELVDDAARKAMDDTSIQVEEAEEFP